MLKNITLHCDIIKHIVILYIFKKASFFIVLPNFVSIFASPLFGFLVDKIGRSALIVLIASCMLVLAHVGVLLNAILLDPLNQISPYAIMIWLGFAYSLGAAALWPMVAFIVDPVVLGTAYGLMTSIQNLGLAVMPSILGAIQDSSIENSLIYTIPIILFICCAGTAAILSFLLIGLDRKYTQGKLMATGEERVEMAKKLLETTLSPSLGDDEEAVLLRPDQLLRRPAITIRAAYLARLGLDAPPRERNINQE